MPANPLKFPLAINTRWALVDVSGHTRQEDLVSATEFEKRDVFELTTFFRFEFCVGRNRKNCRRPLAGPAYLAHVANGSVHALSMNGYQRESRPG